MKTNKTNVVLIPVGYSNSRKVCESIENQSFKTVIDLNKKIEKELGASEFDDQENSAILFYGISDFVSEVNDQNLDVLSDYFISYVTITE